MANPTALDRVTRWQPDALHFGLIEHTHGDYVLFDDYQRTLSAKLQAEHELEQLRLDLAQHQGNASEVIRLQAEVARLRETLAVRDRENGALAEGYLSKIGIKPEDLR